MVLSSERSPRSGVYVIQDVCESDRKLDLNLLKSTWHRVVERHSALRTSIHRSAEGELRPLIHQNPEILWCELEWSGLTGEEREKKLAEFLRDDRERGFDFSQGVPMRFTLIESDNSDTLIWTSHHALLDGRSYLIVWREWFALYDGILVGEAAALTEPEDSRQHAAWLERQDGTTAAHYWRDRLAGLSQNADFIVDRLAVTVPHTGFARENRTLSRESTAELWDFARRHDLTVSNLIQAAWALVLSRYSGSSDIVFGVTRTGRHKEAPGTREMVGLLINTLPVRVAVPRDMPLLAWLQQLRKQSIAMREYEHAPLDQIREWSGGRPGTPLFDSVLVYDHEPPGETLRKLGGGWQQRFVSRLQRTDSPLTVAAHGSPQLNLQIVYDARLFDPRTISGIARHFENLLLSFLSQSDCRLSELRMLTEAEEKWLVHDPNQAGLNRTAASSAELCAHRLFEQQAQRMPGAVALEDSSRSILYGELNLRANRLAAFLREQGAGPEDLIAVCMNRCPEAVVAILAVLKAGAAFLPMDPALPPERLATMFADALPKFVLCKEPHFSKIVSNRVAELNLDRHVEEIDRQLPANLTDAAGPANAAYAIFTSGSSGKPKAVIITHRSLVNHTLAVTQILDVSETDRRLQFASLGSDVFVSEVFTYLSSGAALVFCTSPEGNSIKEFVRLIDKHRITITGVPGTWWNEWVAELASGGSSLPASLRALIVGMERIDPAAFLAWKQLVGNAIRWFNAYGPTETCPTATIYEAGSSIWEGKAFVPIGKPIANTRIYILDIDGNVVPVGVSGELYIGGAGVGRGYLNRVEITAGKFLPDRFTGNSSARIYKTGDIGFRLPDGNLVMLGRVDRQVKIRGFRVELEEIEAALGRHPSVHRCAVVLDGKQKLVAYLTPSEGHAPELDQLRLYLSRQLPAHMIPVAFMISPEMPLTASGKIDYRSLPPPEARQLNSTSGFTEPSTPLEKRLAVLWQEVFLIPRVDVTDDFFRLGGDSLSATILIGLIAREFGRELSLAELLHAPTIARLASILEAEESTRGLGVLRDDIVPFHPAGLLPPIFGITSTADDLLSFRHFANQLGDDQPFFAVKNPVGRELRTAEQLARHVCGRIRDVRPHGPYVLAGFCFGGIVAFEAAHQLLASGEKVRMVVLFESLAPGYPKLSQAGKRYGRHFQNLFAAGGVRFSEIAAHVAVMGRLIANKALARIERNTGVIPRGSGVADPIGQSARTYVPKPLRVPVVQFIAGEQPVSTRILDDPRLGWRDLCQAEFHLHRMRGVHGDASFLKLQAPEMAALLNQLLRKDG